MTKVRSLKREEEVDFFEQFEGVVFGVLKRMSIHYLHADYEEFAQIGRLSLVKAYETFPNDVVDDTHRGVFVSYAFTRIRWAILDVIRQKTRQKEHEQVWDDSFDHTLMDTSSDFEENLYEQEWLESVLSYLNAVESRLVIDLCLYHMTITDIAHKEGVSRQTIYKRRKSIQDKLRHKL